MPIRKKGELLYESSAPPRFIRASKERKTFKYQHHMLYNLNPEVLFDVSPQSQISKEERNRPLSTPLG